MSNLKDYYHYKTKLRPNNYRKKRRRHQSNYNDYESEKSSHNSLEWDFSEESSNEDNVTQTGTLPTNPALTPFYRKQVKRSPSISFAEVDEVVEFTTNNLKKSKSQPGKMLLSKASSVTWNFTDDDDNDDNDAASDTTEDNDEGIYFKNSKIRNKRILFSDELQTGGTPIRKYGRKKSVSMGDLTAIQMKQTSKPRARKMAAVQPGWAVNYPRNEAPPPDSGRLSPPIEDGSQKLLPQYPSRLEASINKIDVAPTERIPAPFFDEMDFDKNRNRFGNLSRLSSMSSLRSMKSTFERVKGGLTKPTTKKDADQKKLIVVVIFFFLVCAGLLALAHVVYHNHIGEIRLFDQLRLEEADRRMLLYDENDNLIIESRLGVSFPHHIHPYPCIDPDNLYHPERSEEKCLEWANIARLRLRNVQIDYNTNCYHLYWESLSKDISPMDCFPTLNLAFNESNHGHSVHKRSLEHSENNQGHWYGGGESLHASWPLEKGNIKLSAFITGDEGRTEWGNFIKKFFLNSRGLSLSIEDHTPLFVSLNDPQDSGLCIQARFDDFAYFYHRFNYPKLNYTVCTDSNIVKLHRQYLPKVPWEDPSRDDVKRMRNLIQTGIWEVPIMSGLSHTLLSQYIKKVIVSDTGDVKKRDRGYLLLNYHWQENMGDLTFNENTFPNIAKTMQIIRNAGLTLALTINPFISTGSNNFDYAVSQSLFVGERNSSKSNVPGLTWFKDVKSCALLDITKKETQNWIKSKLRYLVEQLGDDIVFYVDSGNAFHTPTYFEFDKPLDNPDIYRDNFVDTVSKEVAVIGVSSAAAKRPRVPGFVFMTPLESDWRSLSQIVPNILQLSVIDYPCINSGPIGGISSDSKDKGIHSLLKPLNETIAEEFELYLRWWQLNTFMPIMHFLKPPTAFPLDKIQSIIPKLFKLRKNVAVPHLIKASNEVLRMSTPMIRPLWMMEWDNEFAQEIDDEFLIGDEILVAPILKLAQRSRDVYLPTITHNSNKIFWRNGIDGKIYEGGQWIYHIKVDLENILYFIRVTKP